LGVLIIGCGIIAGILIRLASIELKMHELNSALKFCLPMFHHEFSVYVIHNVYELDTNISGEPSSQ
jgi:hypothetical protein